MRPHTSITEFITDGSLARLCASVERLVGTPVALRDRVGRLIAASTGGVGGAAGAPDALIGEDVAGGRGDFGGFSAPIRIRGEAIGSLTLSTPGPGADASGREEAEGFLSLLASIVSELCEREVELSEQIERLDALQTISSTLVSAGGVQNAIDTGLKTAIDLLGADAGTLRLLDRTGKMLLPRAAVGLSQAYLDEAGPLPANNALDREILAGRVVSVPAFEDDARVKRPHAVRAERLTSMLSAALMFQEEPLGGAAGCTRVGAGSSRTRTASCSERSRGRSRRRWRTRGCSSARRGRRRCGSRCAWRGRCRSGCCPGRCRTSRG